MIIKKICKNGKSTKDYSSCIGLDDQGGLWISTGSCMSKEDWVPVLFNKIYKGYYPECRFTAIGATEEVYVVAGIAEDGLPYVFRSLLGSVWENVNLLFGSQLLGYQRASGMVIEIFYDKNTKQLFMACDNGDLLTIPDCPKCAKIQKVTDEKIVSGHFCKDNGEILLTTAMGKQIRINLDDAIQIKISPDYADRKIKEGGILVDLREMEMEDVGNWLKAQPKDRFIAFICNYGVQADRAAKYAREKGYHEAYSLGGARLQLY